MVSSVPASPPRAAALQLAGVGGCWTAASKEQNDVVGASEPTTRHSPATSQSRLPDCGLQSAEDGVVGASKPPARSCPATGRSWLPDCCPESAEDIVVEAGEPPLRCSLHLARAGCQTAPGGQQDAVIKVGKSPTRSSQAPAAAGCRTAASKEQRMVSSGPENPHASRPATYRSRQKDCGQQSAEDVVNGASESPARHRDIRPEAAAGRWPAECRGWCRRSR
jgi:hypothetical protein